MKSRLVDLYPHQQKAVEELQNGSILCGGVGSGKSITAIAYYYSKVCDYMRCPIDLYIITTARKRDSGDWEEEASKFSLSTKRELSLGGVQVIVDSWNNIQKYVGVKKAFFIFDEQKVVGYGVWAKSFIKIAGQNNWIFLTATPGDTWMDYMAIFIAHGFFKNKSDFIYRHVVPARNIRYFKVDHYINTGPLMHYKDSITVDMPFERNTVRHVVPLYAQYNKDLTKEVMDTRWNVFTQEPLKDANEYCLLLRRIANTDSSRLLILSDVLKKHKRLIVFYNFNYELDLLRYFAQMKKYPCYEWNGQKHDAVPLGDEWLYLVQYTAGAEAWNCTSTNAIFFYSLNYSFKIMEQTAGRIDRMNTPYTDLYYYVILSHSIIDKMILRSLKGKKNFNEKRFVRKMLGNDAFSA